MAKPGPKPKFTHDSLSRVAFSLATKSGLAQLTLSRLAAALHTSPSAIYRYFSSKEELVNAMGAVAMEHAAAALPRQEAASSTGINDFRALSLAKILWRFSRWIHYRREHPVSYTLLMPAVQRDDLSPQRDRLLSYFDEVLDHGVRVAALRPQSSRSRTVLLVSALHGLKPRESNNLEQDLLHTLLCGWGAPVHLLEALTLPGVEEGAS